MKKILLVGDHAPTRLMFSQILAQQDASYHILEASSFGPWLLPPGPIGGLPAAGSAHLPLWGNGTSVWEGCLAVGKVDTFLGLEYAYIHQDQALVSSSNLLVNPNYGGALWLSL